MMDQDTVLVLRTCNADMSSRNGFVWPSEGPVEAPDWEPTVECGHGLHGLLWGCGSGRQWDPTAIWLVVEVETSTIIDLAGKVKFPRGVVVYAGDRYGATAYIAAHGGAGMPIVGYAATAGDDGTATAGAYGTATAGDGGTATAGFGGTATAGDGGTATAGAYSTATAGFGGTATAGDGGTATAGDGGTATAGAYGTATAGDGGTATAGDGGTLVIRWWDGARYRITTGYVGEDGILANIPHYCDATGRLRVREDR